MESTLDKLFQFLPKSRVTGEYIIHHINQDLKNCHHIDVILHPTETGAKKDQYLAELKKGALFSESKKEEFYYQEVVRDVAYLKLTNHQQIQINLYSKGYPEVSYGATNLNLLSEKQLEPRIIPEGVDPEELKFETIIQIQTKVLRFVNDLSSLETSYQKKYGFIKLATQAGNLAKRGWEVQSFISFPHWTTHGKDDICPICQESLTQYRTLALKCNHQYHIKCIRRQLLMLGHGTNLCSICRAEVVG